MLVEVLAEEIANATLKFKYSLISWRLGQQCLSDGGPKRPRSDTYSKFDNAVVQTGVEKHTLVLDFRRIRLCLQTVSILYCKRKARIESSYQAKL